MRVLFGVLRFTVHAAFILMASIWLLLAFLLWSLLQIPDQSRSHSLKEKHHAIRFHR